MTGDGVWHGLYRRGEHEAARFGALGTSIEQLVVDGCARHGDAAALTTLLPGGHSATVDFTTLEAGSRAFAAYLQQQLKLKPDDVVAIQAPNCIGYAICALGVMRAGMTVSNLNPLYTAAETKRQLVDCGASVLVICDLFAGRVRESIDGSGVRTVMTLSLLEYFPAVRRTTLSVVFRLKGLLPRLAIGHERVSDALSRGSGLPFVAPETDLDAPRLYQYSGGTTGVPKGVIISERNLLTNLAQGTSLARETFERPGQTTLLIMPLFHMFGLFMCLTGVCFGGHIVLVASPRPPKNLRPGFEKFPVTVFPGVNTLFAALLREPWFKAKPPRLELTLTGATPLHPDVAARWSAATGGLLVESYGMTECTTVLTSNPPDDRFRTHSVGFPLPGTTLRIVDSNDRELGPGEAGEILAKGPQVTRGYLEQPEENESAFLDGWFRTGDIGYLDEDGYLFLVDRKKDMIIVGGFNVYPNEVEETLNKHPDVVESGVVGVAGADGAERVVAFVVPATDTLTEASLDAWCRNALTPYKCPKAYRFTDELPKTPVGKLLRRELRERAAQIGPSPAAAPVENH